MPWADYHVHSEYSFDSTAELELLCDAARAKGVREFCLTEHIDPGHPDCDQPPDFDAWLRDIARCRAEYPDLCIRTGLEIGDNAARRAQIVQTLDALALDFRLLSLHLVEGLDPYDPAFYEGRTQEQAYRRYVEVKLESVLHFPDYDAVAHLGYCGKFAPYPPALRPLRWITSTCCCATRRKTARRWRSTRPASKRPTPPSPAGTSCAALRSWAGSS